MDTLRPGDYATDRHGWKMRLDAKRVVELGTDVDASVYFGMMQQRPNDEYYPFILVKVTDFSLPKFNNTVHVWYTDKAEGFLDYRDIMSVDETLALDAYSMIGKSKGEFSEFSPRGGMVVNDQFHKVWVRSDHELVPRAAAATKAPSSRRHTVDEDMPFGSFLTRLLLLPEDQVPKAIQQYIVEPYRFKKELKQCARFCTNKSALIRNVLFRYDFLDGVVSMESFYIKDLCKTIVIFGEDHTHPNSCADFWSKEYTGATSATVSHVVEDLMHVLADEECRDDPPFLTLVEVSRYNGGAHDSSLSEFRKDEDFTPHRKPSLWNSFAAAYRLDPRMAVGIDFRDELLEYVLQRGFSRLKVYAKMADKKDLEEDLTSEKSRLTWFVTKGLPFLVEDFPPMRDVVQLVPDLVRDYVLDTLHDWAAQATRTLSEDSSTSKLYDLVFDNFADVMDLYTLCKIVSSTQNLIVVHEGWAHADDLASMLKGLYTMEETMEHSVFSMGKRMKDAYFNQRYDVELETLLEDEVKTNPVLAADLKLAQSTDLKLSCLPLGRKDVMTRWYMRRIHDGTTSLKAILNGPQGHPDKNGDLDEEEDDEKLPYSNVIFGA